MTTRTRTRRTLRRVCPLHARALHRSGDRYRCGCSARQHEQPGSRKR